MKRQRVAVAMSGGVDSSLSAALLQEAGYKVMGVSMQLWCEAKHNLSPSRPTCCSIEDINDARQVCYRLGIPFYVLNLEREFETLVVKRFCQEYSQGRTPNPCLLCNRYLKFDLLWQKVLSLGADYLATGHYARTDYSQGTYRLLKGIDTSRDQSYFLYMLGQRELPRVLFPVGNYLKVAVRRMAKERGLSVSNKPESQDLCFVPDGDYRAFLTRSFPLSPGDIVDSQSKVLGKHPGIACYTVGQRWGLGLASQQRLYVIKIIPADNILVVGPEAELYSRRLFASEVSFVSGQKPAQPVAINVRIRYKSPEAEAILYPLEGTAVEVQFRQPQRAITPGQAVVFYQGDVVLGGGVIEDEDSWLSWRGEPNAAQILMH